LADFRQVSNLLVSLLYLLDNKVVYKGVISLIFGILAFYLSWKGIGFILGIPGLILGISALKSSKGKNKAKTFINSKYIYYAAIALNVFSILFLIALIYLELIVKVPDIVN
jgi:hypothetical protein